MTKGKPYHLHRDSDRLSIHDLTSCTVHNTCYLVSSTAVPFMHMTFSHTRPRRSGYNSTLLQAHHWGWDAHHPLDPYPGSAIPISLFYFIMHTETISSIYSLHGRFRGKPLFRSIYTETPLYILFTSLPTLQRVFLHQIFFPYVIRLIPISLLHLILLIFA